jgi:putative protease
MELLAPAGSPEALDAAVGEGADVVYLGLKDFNARLRSANFTYAQFESALHSLRRMGKKIYVTVNTVFEQREADRMYQFLKYLDTQQPDAIIVQDFGVMEMARSQFPSLRVHASTQMNIASAKGANVLSRYGVSRVVLARELSFEELKCIKSETNIELEFFVHGALCISVSGLCLFSSFLGGKSANRGMCTQACRRLYHPANGSESGYYFSPNDLQLLEYVPALKTAGITALKIEGRMKSASYVGAVVSAYRLVIDAAIEGNEEQIRRSIEQGNEILRNDFARQKTRYFFDGDINKDNNAWLNPGQDSGTGISLGTIIKVKDSGEQMRVLVSPPQGLVLSVRDSVRIHLSGDSGRVLHKLTFVQQEGNFCWISAREGSPGDSVYLIQARASSKRYVKVATHAYRGIGPGRDKAPDINIQMKEICGKRGNIFPEGPYVAVSSPQDLYIVQSSRPQKVILRLSDKNVKYLLGEKLLLPFKPADTILSLEPWFPQEISRHEGLKLAEKIKLLVEMGYLYYIVNNLGHFSLFRDYGKVKLIAGPWLYMFNSWSLKFLSSLGVEGFISPLENSRQNLERTLGGNNRNNENKKTKKRHGSGTLLPELRSRFFITVFNWPPLFNIRATFGSILNFSSFSDNKDEYFFIVTDNDGSRVYPESYFSIIDKIPFLKEAGFGRFIIDISGKAIKKTDYRDLTRAFNEHTSLPYSSRFNWKDGFFNGEVKNKF